jgi:hypothetical protein
MIWLVLLILLIVGIFSVIFFFKPSRKVKPKLCFNIKPQLPTVDQIDNTQQQNKLDSTITPTIKRIHKKTIQKTYTSTTYPLPSMHKGFPVKHNYLKEYQESIITIIPEDSLAFSLLFEAYELEVNGGSKLEIEKILSEARDIDNQAVNTYLSRLAIFKQHNKPDS